MSGGWVIDRHPLQADAPSLRDGHYTGRHPTGIHSCFFSDLESSAVDGHWSVLTITHHIEAERDAGVIAPPPEELELPSPDRNGSRVESIGLPGDPRLNAPSQLSPDRSGSSTAVTELLGEPYFAQCVQEIQDSSDTGTDTNVSVLRGCRDGTEPNTIVVPSVVNEQMTDDSVTSSGSTGCDSNSDSSTDDSTESLTTDRDDCASGNQDDHNHRSLTTDTGLLSIWDVDDMPLLRNRRQVQQQQQQHGKGVNRELHSLKTSRSERENSNGLVQKSDASGTNSYVRSRKRGHREVKRPQNGKYDPSVSRDGKTAGPDLVQWCPVSPRYDISLYEFKIFRSFV